MSIANEALRDLNHQRNLDYVDNVIFDYRLAEVSKQQQLSIRHYFILGALIFSVTLFAIEYFSGKNKPEVIVEVEPVVIDSILIDFIHSDYLQPLEQVPADTGYKVPEAISRFIRFDQLEPEIKEDQVVIYEIVDTKSDQQKITELLTEAEAFLGRDRLTSPKGSSAFDRYESVLAINPDNEQALNGIRQIVERYVSLSDLVISKKQTYKVSGLIQKAHLVGVKYMDMQPILDKYSGYMDKEKLFVDSTKPLPVVANDKIAVKAPEPEVKAVEDKSILPVDHETAATALRLIAVEDYATAIKLLENFIGLTDYWGSSYDLLLSLYLRQDLFDKAQLLVYENKTLSVAQLAEKAAHIFIAREDLSGALELLIAHSPTIKENLSYYALKAGLFFKLERFTEAKELYSALVHYQYSNAHYWLGLAVSMDAMGKEDAVVAFRYARDYADTDSLVAQYIQQRVISNI